MGTTISPPAFKASIVVVPGEGKGDSAAIVVFGINEVLRFVSVYERSERDGDAVVQRLPDGERANAMWDVKGRGERCLVHEKYGLRHQIKFSTLR